MDQEQKLLDHIIPEIYDNDTISISYGNIGYHVTTLWLQKLLQLK